MTKSSIELLQLLIDCLQTDENLIDAAFAANIKYKCDLEELFYKIERLLDEMKRRAK